MSGMIPRALEPPPGPVSVLTSELVWKAVEMSRRSPRRRVILPLHPSHADPLHRMLNAVQPGTYIQPHRHLAPPKAEAIVVLRGAVRFFVFTEMGEIAQAHTLSAASGQLGLDARPGVYHTFVTLEADTVLFEVKPGPYQITTDKEFAPWAPAEGSLAASEYLRRLEEVIGR